MQATVALCSGLYISIINTVNDSLDGGSVPCKTYTDTEKPKIFIHVTNGVRILDVRVRAADDRPLDDAAETSIVSKAVPDTGEWRYGSTHS